MINNLRFRCLFLIFTVLTVNLAIFPNPGLPVTGVSSFTNTIDNAPAAMPKLSAFASTLKSGPASSINGVYVSDTLAYPVTQQPSGNAGFVSTQANTLTQFAMASQYKTIGLLAHDYLAGASFFNLKVGQYVVLIYGGGTLKYFQISEIRQFQALTPSSPYSTFIDLANQKKLSADDLFYQTYGVGNQLIFQTCISKNSVSSWGRIFVIAKPVDQMVPLYEQVVPVLSQILRSAARMFART